ncbi:MAG TPA: hypothetical protein V6C57_10995 [Coleofasciculaceae cyanobacterium]
MPPAQRLPVSMRHLKTRLNVLRRPMVWASASVLLAAGYVLFQSWNGAEQPNSSGSLTNSASQNPARRNPLLGANYADEGGSTGFGDLPGLSGDPLQPNAIPGLEPASPAAAESRNPKHLAASTVGKADRSHLDPAESLDPLSSNTDIPSSSLNSTFNANSSNRGTSSLGEPSMPTSPLQSALDRNLGGTGATSPAPAADGMAVPSPSSSVSPSFSSGQSSQFQPSIPRTSPPPGSTGYTMPPAFRTPATSSSATGDTGFSNFSRLQPVPGSTAPSNPSSSSGYGQRPAPSQGSYLAPTPSQIPQAEPAPFSVPRTPPGQSIGGGQINTFSNP